MHRPGDKFFAATGWAGDEQAAEVRSNPAHAAEEFEHRGAAPDESVEAEGGEQFGVELKSMQVSSCRLDGLSDASAEMVSGERLRQIICCAFEDGVNRRRWRIVLADEDDLGARVLQNDASQQVRVPSTGNLWIQQNDARLLSAH